MQIEITLQRLCGVMAYYTYPKNEDSRKTQQYVICVPRHNQEVPDTLFVEVPVGTLTLEGSVIGHRDIPLVFYDKPEAVSKVLPQMLEQIEEKAETTEPTKSKLSTIKVGSLKHLLSQSANSKSYLLTTVPISARAYYSVIPTIQSGRFFLQHVYEKGESIALILRDYHNEYFGYRVHGEELEYHNGYEDASVTLFLAGGHILASLDSQGRMEYHLHKFENIIWEQLDEWEASSLVNKWLKAEIDPDYVAQDTINTLKRDVLMRNKELGLVPVDAWANDLFENMFDSNPNRMTDDEYEMVFGEER